MRKKIKKRFSKVGEIGLHSVPGPVNCGSLRCGPPFVDKETARCEI
jgi:hypothetical protein